MSAPPLRSRPLLFSLPVLAGSFIALVLFALAADYRLWMSWSGWLPYGHWPVFGDLSVTLGHLDEAAAGMDPLDDPDSEFAYPRVVLYLHHLGLQYIPAAWLGLLQTICVVIGIVYILRPDTWLRAVAVAALLFTPPMLLGFERANLDFALFLLCALCASAWARARTTTSLVAPVAGMLVAAAMKLHPVFALFGAVFAETGRRRLVWLVGLTLLLMYWTFTYADLGLIGRKVPVSTWGSWGCLLFFVRLERFLELDRAAYVWLLDARWPLIAVITYAVAATAAFAAGLKMSARFVPVRWRAQDCTYYWVGASICCGSFVGANLAYRWIFVLLAVPLLIRAAGVPDRVVATWSRLTLIAIAMSLLAPLRADRLLFLATQFANWTCILLLIAGCAALRRAVTLDFQLRTPAPVCPARNPAHVLTSGRESNLHRGNSEKEVPREVPG